jgi:hypothetical protein
MAEARETSRGLHERVRPDLDAIREAARIKIRALLDEPQRREYEKIVEERRKRHRHRRHGP